MKNLSLIFLISCITFSTINAQNKGSKVSCADNFNECLSCGSTQQIQQMFAFADGNCFVSNCDNIGTTRNGWICQSCYNGDKQATEGQYFDGQNCVQDCPKGYKADQSTGFVCRQPNPGALVQCSNNSQNCNGCGVTPDQQSLFAYVSGKNCQVKDCHQYAVVGLYGWVCKSCALATGTDNIPQGDYYDPTTRTCVKNCPEGYVANDSTKYECQPIPIAVPCSNDSSTCNGCGNNIISKYFQYVSRNNCIVQDCMAVRSYNGWVCNSCRTVDQNTPFQGMYFNGSQCTESCPNDQSASAATGFTCQTVNPGAIAQCSIDSQTCGGCGSTTSIQNLFTHVKDNVCAVTDCSSNIIGTNLNGWVCNSCKSASGIGNIAAGQYFDGKTCVAKCPEGKQASLATGFVCQYPPSPGADVACYNQSTICGGCGTTNAIQTLFTNKKGSNNCSVIDCNQSVVGSNLNGWVCNSCSQVSGPGNIPVGQYFDGTTCVSSCPNGYSASANTGYVCKSNANPGNDVACSSDSSTCGGCGSTNAIQGLFTHGKGNNCSATDCSATVIGSNLNGWVCKSCSQASGSGNIAAGQYYDGKTCVASCPSGQSAIEATGYVCKATSNPSAGNNGSTTTSNSSLISYVLGLIIALIILF
ncbi:hypothetical protein ABPG73_002859 [Tetrahymena malaccensis]